MILSLYLAVSCFANEQPLFSRELKNVTQHEAFSIARVRTQLTASDAGLLEVEATTIKTTVYLAEESDIAVTGQSYGGCDCCDIGIAYGEHPYSCAKATTKKVFTTDASIKDIMEKAG